MENQPQRHFRRRPMQRFEQSFSDDPTWCDSMTGPTTTSCIVRSVKGRKSLPANTISTLRHGTSHIAIVPATKTKEGRSDDTISEADWDSNTIATRELSVLSSPYQDWYDKKEHFTGDNVVHYDGVKSVTVDSRDESPSVQIMKQVQQIGNSSKKEVAQQKKIGRKEEGHEEDISPIRQTSESTIERIFSFMTNSFSNEPSTQQRAVVHKALDASSQLATILTKPNEERPPPTKWSFLSGFLHQQLPSNQDDQDDHHSEVKDSNSQADADRESNKVSAEKTAAGRIESDFADATTTVSASLRDVIHLLQVPKAGQTDSNDRSDGELARLVQSKSRELSFWEDLEKPNWEGSSNEFGNPPSEKGKEMDRIKQLANETMDRTVRSAGRYGFNEQSTIRTTDQQDDESEVAIAKVVLFDPCLANSRDLDRLQSTDDTQEKERILDDNPEGSTIQKTDTLYDDNLEDYTTQQEAVYRDILEERQRAKVGQKGRLPLFKRSQTKEDKPIISTSKRFGRMTVQKSWAKHPSQKTEKQETVVGARSQRSTSKTVNSECDRAKETKDSTTHSGPITSVNQGTTKNQVAVHEAIHAFSKHQQNAQDRINNSTEPKAKSDAFVRGSSRLNQMHPSIPISLEKKEYVTERNSSNQTRIAVPVYKNRNVSHGERLTLTRSRSSANRIISKMTSMESSAFVPTPANTFSFGCTKPVLSLSSQGDHTGDEYSDDETSTITESQGSSAFVVDTRNGMTLNQLLLGSKDDSSLDSLTATTLSTSHLHEIAQCGAFRIHVKK